MAVAKGKKRVACKINIESETNPNRFRRPFAIINRLYQLPGPLLYTSPFAMSSREALESVARVMATCNMELRALPDELKCAKCRSVLKDACQMPCECRFCRACVAAMVESGHQFCPGGLQQCAGTPLSTAAPDYRANKSIMRLTAGCPRAGCSHECPLADMEAHLRACSRGSIECPFRALGCVQGALPGEQMSGHLLQESRGHSEILIGLVANINRELEVLKRELALRDEQGGHLENEMKLIAHENKSIKSENKSISIENEAMKNEIRSMKLENEAIKDENKSIKIEMKSIREENESMKNEIRSIKLENEAIKDENKSIKIEMKSMKKQKESITLEIKLIRDENEAIKREREALCERVQRLEGELAGISAVTREVASNRDALGTEMEPVRDEIRSIKEQLDAMRCQVESMQVPVGVSELSDWLIDEDVGETNWGYFGNSIQKTSSKFRQGGRPHNYELSSWNHVFTGQMGIWLRIWPGPSDAQLQWPFRGKVTITVANGDGRGACSSQTQQCEIERPGDNQYSVASEPIRFQHAELRRAGLVLERGVRVSCRVEPGVGQ